MHIMCRCVNYNTINNICVYRADSYSAQNGSESRFRDRCFSVELLHIMVCSIASLDLYCTIVGA